MVKTGEKPGAGAFWLKRIRRWFLTGLIILAPAFVTALALRWLFGHVDRPFRQVMADVTGYDIPGAGVVMVFVLLIVTGAVASNIIIRSVLKWVESTLDRIPLVRTIYSGVKQLTAPLAEDRGGSFQNVVVIEYPDAHSYALGFLIKSDVGVSPRGESLSAVLVPTNHLHLGNVALCPQSRIHHVGLTTEEGLRFLVSMGAALPRRLDLAAVGAANDARNA